MSRKLALGLATLVWAGLVHAAELPAGLQIGSYADAKIEVNGNAVKANAQSDTLSGITISASSDLDGERGIISFKLQDTKNLSMRLDAAGQQPRWLAPNPTNRLLVTKKGKEVYTLYGTNRTYDINVHDLSLETCDEPFEGDCLAPGDIRGIVENTQGFPGYDDQKALALFLLDWASVAADFSLSFSLQQQAENLFSSMNAAQIYSKFFKDNKLGGYCSATSVFFAKVLREFGIDAFTINFGIPNSVYTHVSVVWRDGENYYFLDPTFNGTFVSGDNLASVIEVASNKELRFLGGNLSEREFLYDRRTEHRTLQYFIERLSMKCPPDTSSEIVACRIKDYGIDFYYDIIPSEDRISGVQSGPETFRHMLREGIFSVGPALDLETPKRFLELAKANHIPLHGQ